MEQLKPEEIEFFRQTLKAVGPHYPGFLEKEMAKNIDAICNLALVGLECEKEHK